MSSTSTTVTSTVTSVAAQCGPTIVIARHAQRADGFDVKRKWMYSDPPPKCPWNPPLTALGERQAGALGERLKELVGRPDVCYCSPLVRCVTTAACALRGIGATSPSTAPPQIRLEQGVVEFLERQWYMLWKCNSDAHPLANTNVATLFPNAVEAGEEARRHGVGVDASYSSFIDIGSFEPSFKNFETWAQLRARVRRFIVEVQRKHRGERVLVVTHGAVVSAFIDELVPSLQGSKKDVQYASLSVFSPLPSDVDRAGEDCGGDVVSLYKADILCEHAHIHGVE